MEFEGGVLSTGFTCSQRREPLPSEVGRAPKNKRAPPASFPLWFPDRVGRLIGLGDVINTGHGEASTDWTEALARCVRQGSGIVLGPRAGTASAAVRAGAGSLVGQRPGMLLNSLRCTGRPSQERTTQPEVSWCGGSVALLCSSQAAAHLPSAHLQFMEQADRGGAGWGGNHDCLTWTVF